MSDMLDSRTPILDALLRALKTPSRTAFEIKALDVMRDRSEWVLQLEREIAGRGWEACAAPTWQPIATAPDEIKDNQTPILLWTPNTAVVGSFDNDEWYILGSRYVIEATHWMPLPAPPSPERT